MVATCRRRRHQLNIMDDLEVFSTKRSMYHHQEGMCFTQ